jgi:DNA helicase-2/ATP-dependent DNA helicase PcrA
MTIHTAKGLEFPHVFLVGAEDGLFPSLRSMDDGAELEEERRLCYVAITRAKQSLTVTHARQRMLYGRTTAGRLSRFIGDIPPELLSPTSRPRPPKPQSVGREGRMFYDDLPFAERGGWEQARQRQSPWGTGAGYGTGRAGTGDPSPTDARGSLSPAGGTRRADVGVGPYGSRSSGAGSSPLRPGMAAERKAPTVEYRPGDTVQHSSFGRGMVLRVTKMGNDAMLEIAFDEKGTKRLLANTASAHMKKL